MITQVLAVEKRKSSLGLQMGVVMHTSDSTVGTGIPNRGDLMGLADQPAEPKTAKQKTKAQWEPLSQGDRTESNRELYPVASSGFHVHTYPPHICTLKIHIPAMQIFQLLEFAMPNRIG